MELSLSKFWLRLFAEADRKHTEPILIEAIIQDLLLSIKLLKGRERLIRYNEIVCPVLVVFASKARDARVERPTSLLCPRFISSGNAKKTKIVE